MRTVTTHACLFFVAFLRSHTDPTTRPISMRNGLFDAVPCEEVPFGSQRFNNFLRGSFFPKTSKISMTISLVVLPSINFETVTLTLKSVMEYL
jgi:hypothetical protein